MTDLFERQRAAAVVAAWHAGANVVSVLHGPSVESLDWARLGKAPAYDRQTTPQAFATFLRTSGVDPLHGGEALFRWASARDYTGAPAENWRKIPRAIRGAFHAFAVTLAALDAFFAVERLAAEDARQQRLAARRGPVPAAALALPDEDRLDEMLADPLALVGWAKPATMD